MDYKMLDDILSDAVNDSELVEKDIPSIALYLDQIVNIIKDKSLEGSPRFSNRALTKTMVNNYSKAGLIFPINGKKYSREQIIQILLINSLKNVFSIAEIKGLLESFYTVSGTEEETLSELYNAYTDIRQRHKQSCPETIKQMIADNGLDIESENDYILAILNACAAADYYACIAHAMLEIMLPQDTVEMTPEEAAEAEEDAVRMVEDSVKRQAKAIKKKKKRDDKALKKANKELSKKDKSIREIIDNSTSLHTDTEIEDELMMLEDEVDRALTEDSAKEGV